MPASSSRLTTKPPSSSSSSSPDKMTRSQFTTGTTYSSYRSTRPLPSGPGPLSTAGRPLGPDFSIKPRTLTTSRSGPLNVESSSRTSYLGYKYTTGSIPLNRSQRSSSLLNLSKPDVPKSSYDAILSKYGHDRTESKYGHDRTESKYGYDTKYGHDRSEMNGYGGGGYKSYSGTSTTRDKDYYTSDSIRSRSRARRTSVGPDYDTTPTRRTSVDRITGSRSSSIAPEATRRITVNEIPMRNNHGDVDVPLSRLSVSDRLSDSGRSDPHERITATYRPEKSRESPARPYIHGVKGGDSPTRPYGGVSSESPTRPYGGLSSESPTRSYGGVSSESPTRGGGVGCEPPLSVRNDINGSEVTSPEQSNKQLTDCTSKYANRGEIGLRNLGNTCFMNSVLQSLSHTSPLLEYCLGQDYNRDINKPNSRMKGALITAYVALMDAIWRESSESYVSPNSFKTQIQRFAPRFMGYQQQDAQEFLRYLLEGLHEDVNRVNKKEKRIPYDEEADDRLTDSEKAVEYWNRYLHIDNSRVQDIFVGQLRSELKFSCGHSSVTFDPFWDLSLPIPKGKIDTNLQDCLNLFMKEEELEDEERPTCAKCKSRKSCRKRFSIQKFPRTLVFHLKRFSQEMYRRKLATHVTFPVNHLNMSQFNADKGSTSVTYDLYAVCNHSGGTHSGHYTAHCKHPYSQHWNYFNDTRVTRARAKDIVSSEAYILFYELSSSQPPSRL